MGSSGCPRCFGKTHRCSFDYKKKGCDKKTITNKKDAVQELVDMKLISKEEKTKIEEKKVLRTIKNLENPLHCCEKKGEIRLQKQLQKSKKARMTHRTKLLEKKKKKKKKSSRHIKKKKKRTETEKNKERRKNNRTVRGRAKNVIWISRSA